MPIKDENGARREHRRHRPGLDRVESYGEEALPVFASERLGLSCSRTSDDMCTSSRIERRLMAGE